jgi:hypothetical protein
MMFASLIPGTVSHSRETDHSARESGHTYKRGERKDRKSEESFER